MTIRCSSCEGMASGVRREREVDEGRAYFGLRQLTHPLNSAKPALEDQN